MNARFMSAVGVLVLSTQAVAQSGYNVDIANPSSTTVPANTYGAASGQTGTWNACWPTGSPQAIVNTAGSNQGVTLTGAGGYPVLTYDNASTSGNADSLLDDFHDTDAAAETATWTFAGLQPGQYQVYTYAMAPDGSSFTSSVNVLQSSSGAQTVGGSFGSGFVQGVTHAVHTATVGTNEQLTIEVTASSQYASISGFQIIFVTGSPNDPPAQVANPTPSNNATGVAVTSQLCWSNGGGASTYDVYFGTDSTPDSTEFIGNQIGTCWDPPGNLAYSTTYYWRVDAKNSAGTTTGPVWSFSTAAAPPQPPSPVTSPSPSNGATNVLITAAVSWSNGGGATSYDVYFGTDSTPDSGEFIGNQTSTTWDPPGNLANSTTYYWRVDAKNSAGTTTGAVWSFTTQAPVVNPPALAINPSPANNATGVLPTTQVCWSNGGGATSYDVYFGIDSTPDSTEFQLNTTSICWDPPGNLAANTTYYWRIDAKNSGGTTTGNTWSFTTHPATVTISGQITLDGAALAGVTIVANNGGGSALTDANGNYALSNVPYNWSGTITPTLDGHGFTPGAYTFSNLTANASGKNFIASVGLQIITMNGEMPDDQFGRTVLNAGDVDGDGVPDFAIAAPLADAGTINTGKVYVYSGATLQLIGSVLTGITEGDQFGTSIAAGDVDGDGRSDLLVGAPFVDGAGKANSGAVFLFSFKDNVWNVMHARAGVKAGDRFGHAVALADVDADGLADLIVGAPYNDDIKSNAGRVYVYSGATFDQLKRMGGENKSDLFGFSVARIGKVNNDDKDDFVVGAPYNDEGGSNAGKVYVYSGAKMTMSGTPSPIRTHTGLNPKDQYGLSVFGIGNADGDSRDDYAVGAPYYNTSSDSDAGRLSVYSGSNGEQLWAKNGSNKSDLFGWSISGGFDINGDGHADVITGPYKHDAGGLNAGKAIIRNGADGALVSSQFTGLNAGDWYGYAVAMIDDLDGDGIAEMLIGAPHNNDAGDKTGAAYLYLSAASGYSEANLPEDESSDDGLTPDDAQSESEASTSISLCEADVANNDGVVNADDLQAVINAMGEANSSNAAFDFNADGTVDALDIAIVMN